MRIVIAGGDDAALRLAESLMGSHEIALLLPNQQSARQRAELLEVEAHIGPATSTALLREAGVATADLFVACTTKDEENLIGCVNARRLGARRTICFLFRPDAEADEEEEISLADSLGIDVVVRPVRLLAEEIVRIVTVPGALDVEAFVGGRVHLYRHAIEPGVPLTRGALKDVGVPEGTVFVMVRRDDHMFLPKGDTLLQAGDKLTVMGTREGIDRLMRTHLRAPEAPPEERRATVVGGGNVGLATAHGLERAGWTVKVIEKERLRCDEIAPQLHGLVLHGDGTDLDLLESERVGDDSVVVAVTSNDEKNLLVSLLAKSLGVHRIVTRADNADNERLFEKVGVDVVRSARGAAVNSVLRGFGQARHELLAELEHGDAEVIDLQLPEDLPSVPLVRMKSDVFAIIGAILRGGKVIIPRGSDAVEGRDRILVFCRRAEEEKVREFFLNGIRRLAGA